MSPSDRFALTILAITLMTGLIGWLLRYVFKTSADATRDNTRAIRELNITLGEIRERLVHVETLVNRADQKRPRHGGSSW